VPRPKAQVFFTELSRTRGKVEVSWKPSQTTKLASSPISRATTLSSLTLAGFFCGLHDGFHHAVFARPV